MEKVIIATTYYDRVILRSDAGETIAWLTLSRESVSCFYDTLNNLLLKPNGSALYLSGFGTIKSCRNKGYGRELIEFALSEYGDDIIYLGVSSCDENFTNEELIKFYERVGFKKIEYDLPYQFMVYDKFGKINESDLHEKVVKITPVLSYFQNEHKKYKLPGLEGIHITNTNSLIYDCAFLKHQRHVGYCQLFAMMNCKDSDSPSYKFELYPLADKDGNDILIEYDRDYMHAYISRSYMAGKCTYELEVNDNWGINT